MKNKILIKISKIIAIFYWSYLKKEIDSFDINQKLKNKQKIADDVLFKGGGSIYYAQNLSIGNHVQIGENCFIMAIGGVTIGDGTIISRNVCIHSGNHNYKSKKTIPYDENYVKRKVVIGKAVWIGQNVNILPGVTIDNGAIIGMGTTISKNVSKGEIVVGTGQRSLGFRDEQDFDQLLKKESFFGKEFSQV